MNLGEYVKLLRSRKGFSVEELCEYCQIDKSNIKKIKNIEQNMSVKNEESMKIIQKIIDMCE